MNRINRYYKIDDDGFIGITKDEFGDPRRFILLKTYEAKQFAGYTLMNKDLESTLDALRELQSSDKSVIIQQSLITFAIVTYCKCFISNRGGRGVTLNERDIFKDADQSIKDDHKELMNLRNEYIAHAGSEFEKCLVSGTLVTINRTFMAGIDVNSYLFYMVNMPPKLEDFMKLCNFVKDEIQVKSKKVLSKISNDLSKNAQETYNNSVKPDLNNIYRMVEVKTSSGISQVDFIRVPPNQF